jgi:hypothetical protein
VLSHLPKFIACEADREWQGEFSPFGFVDEAGVHAGSDGM